ncbi:hypothetical protein ABMB44_14905 [Levilactobacillus brevis]
MYFGPHQCHSCYQGAGNQTPADHTASVNFTRSVSTDAVTGEKTYGAWSAEQSF